MKSNWSSTQEPHLKFLNYILLINTCLNERNRNFFFLFTTIKSLMTVSRCVTHTDLSSVLSYLLHITLQHRLLVKIGHLFSLCCCKELQTHFTANKTLDAKLYPTLLLLQYYKHWMCKCNLEHNRQIYIWKRIGIKGCNIWHLNEIRNHNSRLFLVLN